MGNYSPEAIVVDILQELLAVVNKNIFNNSGDTKARRKYNVRLSGLHNQNIK